MVLPWQILLIFLTTIGAAVIVSLRTAPPEAARTARFYALARTPIRDGEVVPAPCVLPVDAVVPEPRWWLAFRGIYIPRPERRTVTGFLVCSVLVAVLIIGFLAILAV
jgi:hypothetical protein